jgi:sugar lactone lactonase YvrE
MRTLLALLLLTSPVLAQHKMNTTAYMAAAESVVSHGEHLYIADIGPGFQPQGKDTNGVIWKTDLTGNNPVKFAEGLDAPKGIIVAGNTVFVTDIDHVKGYDLASGKQLYNISFTTVNTTFLNDLTAADAQTLYVSAMDTKKIYVIHLKGEPRFEEVKYTPELEAVNGLYFDGASHRLYVCSFGSQNVSDGQIGYVDLKAADVKPFVAVSKRLGRYDGIALLDKNTVVVSDWMTFGKTGVLVKVNMKNGSSEVINKEGIAGPADFTLTAKGEIITPAMLEGNIMHVTTGK